MFHSTECETCFSRVETSKRRAGLTTTRLPGISEVVILTTGHQKTALRVARIFFGTWLLLALAIADFPPPPGFVILVMLLLACALLIYLRVPVYLRWRAEGAKGRVLRVGRGRVAGRRGYRLAFPAQPRGAQYPARVVGPPHRNRRIDRSGCRLCAGGVRLRLMAMPTKTRLNSEPSPLLQPRNRRNRRADRADNPEPVPAPAPERTEKRAAYPLEIAWRLTIDVSLLRG